jgi:hypothetical protein
MACTTCGDNATRSYNYFERRKPEVTTTEAKTVVRKWTALPLYDKGYIPDDMDVIAGSNEEGGAYRLPIQRILPGGDLNLLSVDFRDTAEKFNLGTSQVIPAYIDAIGEIQAAKATPGRFAHVLIIGQDLVDKNQLVLQSSGFVKFPRTHGYPRGATFYLSTTNEGEVTTTKPSTNAQALFTVIDPTTLNVNIQLV